MTVQKLSQITHSPSNMATADFLVGVTAANADVLFSPSQSQSVIGGRTILTANTTFYVATTGSNSNDGSLANPWLTIQFALDFIGSHIDAHGFTVTLQIEDGSYPGGTVNQLPLDAVSAFGGLVIQGNTVTPANVTVDDTGNGFAAFAINLPQAVLTIQYMSINLTTAFGTGVDTFWPLCFSTTRHVTFTTTTTTATPFVLNGANSEVQSFNNTLSGGTWLNFGYANAPNCLFSEFSDTISGSPTFTPSLIQTDQGGFNSAFDLSISGNPTFTGNFLNIDAGGIVATGSSPITNTRVILHGVVDDVEYSISKQISGLPTTSDLTSTSWSLFKDTSGGGVYLAYNDAGTIKKVALT